MSALLDQAFDNLLLLPAWFHTHFGPNSPPLADQLVALQSFLSTWIVNLVTGDPTAFFLYITLPVLMLSAFFRRDKELKKAEETKEKAVSSTVPFLTSPRRLALASRPVTSNSNLTSSHRIYVFARSD